MDKKILAVVVVVILIAFYFFLKVKTRKSAPKEKLKKKRSRPRKRRSIFHGVGEASLGNDDDDEDDDYDEESYDDVDEEEVLDDAEELFNLVHDRMASGMQSSEFMDLAGDIADNLAFIELKQLYNDASNKGDDPIRSVTVDDYIEVFKKLKSGEH